MKTIAMFGAVTATVGVLAVWAGFLGWVAYAAVVWAIGFVGSLV